MATAYLTVGLGYGDEGKGTTVDYLVREAGATLVVRTNGGAQCGHNVVLTDGKHHCFRQFGSGTLAGAETLLGPGVLVNPILAIKEDKELRTRFGIGDPLGRLYVSRDALVTTPYHRSLNRIKELARGNNRHGSCGMGIGETRAYHEDNPILAPRIGDLTSPRLWGVLARVRRDLEAQARSFVKENPISDEHAEEVWREVGTFDHNLLDQLVEGYLDFVRAVRIVSQEEIVRMVATQTTVFEGAQGALLDEFHGVEPYRTWTDTTLDPAMKIVQAAGVDVVRLGITRAYSTRHGTGPFPGQTRVELWDEPHNPTNPWQGSFRTAALNLRDLLWAKKIVGGLEGLVVTHCDRLLSSPWWQVVYPETAGEFVSVVQSAEVLNLISDRLKTPIAIISKGPTAADKTALRNLNLLAVDSF